MDTLDSEGDCDGNGDRPFLHTGEGFLLAESWPAAEPLGPWPAGAVLEGTLYLTTDVESSYDLFFVLATGSLELARTEVQRVTARDAGFGLGYTEVPISATLGMAVPPDAKVRLELHLDFQATATSYFVGYEEDHVSSFSLRSP